MMTFRNHRLRDFAVPMGTNWLLNDIAEAKGKQGLYPHQSPQMLKALREMALVQSVESSNRIEGVMFPAAERSKVLFESLAAERINCMFLNTFLFEWKTAE